MLVHLICHIFSRIKLRMVMENVSKRQQPNQKAENSCRPLMGHQFSKKNPAPWGMLQLSPYQKMCIRSEIMGVKLNVEIYKWTKIKNHTRLTKARGSWCGIGTQMQCWQVFWDLNPPPIPLANIKNKHSLNHVGVSVFAYRHDLQNFL